MDGVSNKMIRMPTISASLQNVALADCSIIANQRVSKPEGGVHRRQ
jgi:hypothetical protein